MLIGIAQVWFFPLHVPLHPAVKSSWLYNLLQQPAACWNNGSLSMQSMLTCCLSPPPPLLARKFVHLNTFEGSLSHDYNSPLFIYLFKPRHFRGWLPCGTVTTRSSLPFCCLPYAASGGGKKQGKAFELLAPLLGDAKT